MINVLKSKNEFCTGCGACRNICPHNAINMVADAEGFLVPVIDKAKCVNCGLCEKRCPVLNPQYKNELHPKCYAAMGSDELRMVSSSGGMFTLFAEEILKDNGAVFGAAWQENWQVRQIKAETEAELAPLRGSKYVQGDSALSFRETKEILDSGRAVLYTGLPCQIAGLYAFLGAKDYPKLYTMEVCCHGAPSHKALTKYLKDEYGDREISKISFRDKAPFGWTTPMSIYFADGDITHIRAANDKYYAGFLPCMIMRKSCGVCKFSRMPRQADLTVGDFWGVERVNPKWNDNKGTSFVIVNSDKGTALLEAVKPKLKFLEDADFDAITYINKTILHPFRQHPGRKHFYSSMDLKPFGKLVKDSLEHHYDIGIAGLWYGINYGSALTYYALYEVLKAMGKDPVFLPKPNSLWEERFNAPETIAQKFIWKHCNVFAPFKSDIDFYHANELCDDFIVGSDVVWHYSVCGRQSDMFFYLDFVNSGRRKIAYAASCGGEFYGNDRHTARAVAHLNLFDSIAVRENEGVEIINKELPDKEVSQVLDPVFLADPAVYHKAAEFSTLKKSGKYIFSYLFKNFNINSLRKFHQLFGADFALRLCRNPNIVDKSFKCEYFVEQPSVEDWLWYMKNCDYYFGGSYHALCFSLIFHRPFVIIFPKAEKEASVVRFKSLLGKLGLEDRFFHDWDDLAAMKQALLRPIDWEKVDAKLDELRQSSRAWLLNALAKPPRPVPDAELIQEERLRKVVKEFDLAGERVDVLTRRIESSEAELAQQKKECAAQQLVIEDAHRKADMQNQQLDMQRMQLDMQNRRLDEQRMQLDMQNQQLDEQKRIMEEQRLRMEYLARPWIIRKLKGGIQCLKDNGFWYTFVLFWKKVFHIFR